MRKIILVILIGVFTLLSSCSESDSNSINNIETAISQEDSINLKFLREEEKLARDVYLYSFEKYNDPIFSSIASSEQQHMDRVLTLLNIYQIPDPTSTERGIFTDQVLQDLYNNLIELSDGSIEDALKVGALIEDLDINDLDNLQNSTSNEDVTSVCEFLECGSRNHLRSFIGKLELINYQYLPVYISIEDYNDIISKPREFCGAN
jgi:hypothetical protein